MRGQNIIGAAASAAWVERHGLETSRTPHWYVEIIIPTDSADTQFEINIYPEEWGVIFRRAGRVSSLRVTDVPFVHGHDDHRLLAQLPDLERVDELLVVLERRYDITFPRADATVLTNLVQAKAVVRSWLVGRP